MVVAGWMGGWGSSDSGTQFVPGVFDGTVPWDKEDQGMTVILLWTRKPLAIRERGVALF